MIMFSTMGVIASLTLAMPHLVTTPASAVLMLTLNSLSTAVIDVVIDARVVEMSRLDPKNGANDLQSLSWGSLSVGGMLGSFCQDQPRTTWACVECSASLQWVHLWF